MYQDYVFEIIVKLISNEQTPCIVQNTFVFSYYSKMRNNMKREEFIVCSVIYLQLNKTILCNVFNL